MEDKYVTMAAQLRKPEGEDGLKTASNMNEGNRFMNLEAIRILNPAVNDTILEIGMGNGLFVKEILSKSNTIKYTGLDYSSLMVAEAIKLNKDAVEESRAKFIEGDISEMPFDSNSFNKIFTVNTIYFWKDVGKVLAELRRVLRKDGVLIIGIRPKHQMIHYPFTKHGFTMYNADELSTILKANSFSVKELHHVQEPPYEYNGTTYTMESLFAEARKL